MKKIALFTFVLALASAGYSQSMKEKMAAKMAGGSGGGGGGAAKVVEAPEGEYSDPSGLSGTYYVTPDMPYGDGKKVAKVIKIEFNAAENEVIMHAMKGEDDPSKLYMNEYKFYARDNFKLSQFSMDNYHLFTVEPGVMVFGKSMWAPEGYPGKTSNTLLADSASFPSVILVKDQSKLGSYTSVDANRLLGEQATHCEIYNTLRLAEKTPLPRMGSMTSEKDLIGVSVELMKAKWADSKEPACFKGCYIYNDEWAGVSYGKLSGNGTYTFSDEVTAIMMFQEPATGLCYYYAIGISRESNAIKASGINTTTGLHMTGNSTIQYITKATMDVALAAIGK
jgi:hypothetical protein